MLSERGSKGADRAWCVRQLNGHTSLGHFSGLGMIELDRHLTMFHLWVCKDFRHIVDFSDTHISFGKKNRTTRRVFW